MGWRGGVLEGGGVGWENCSSMGMDVMLPLSMTKKPYALAAMKS